MPGGCAGADHGVVKLGLPLSRRASTFTTPHFGHLRVARESGGGGVGASGGGGSGHGDDEGCGDAPMCYSQKS